MNPDALFVCDAFVVGQKADVAYARARVASEQDLPCTSSMLAGCLPEHDSVFLREVLPPLIREKGISRIERDRRDVTAESTLRDIEAWPAPQRARLIEHCVAYQHHHHSDWENLIAQYNVKRFSCLISVDHGKNDARYRLPVQFATREPAQFGLVIDTFVRRDDAYLYIDVRNLQEFRVGVGTESWAFTFRCAARYPKNEFLLRRAIFPHRLVGLMALRRHGDTWCVERCLPNPIFLDDHLLNVHRSVPDHESKIARIANDVRLWYVDTGGPSCPSLHLGLSEL
jgi:hypothetical protein